MSELGLSDQLKWYGVAGEQRWSIDRKIADFLGWTAAGVQTCFARVLKALHDSRQRTAEREIERHRHLICRLDSKIDDVTR